MLFYLDIGNLHFYLMTIFTVLKVCRH